MLEKELLKNIFYIPFTYSPHGGIFILDAEWGPSVHYTILL